MHKSRIVLFLGLLSLVLVRLGAQGAFDDEAFELSGEQAKAEREVAFAESYGAFLEGDYRRAVKLAKPLAKRGMSDAQHLMGLCYQHGLGVRVNGKRAEYWFRLAAEQMHAPAMLAAGEFAFGGYGRDSHFELAHNFLEPLTRLDWSFAQRIEDMSVQRAIRSRASYLLGLLFADGLGGEKDIDRALSLMGRASNTGDAWASMYLAMEYAKGEVVERDVEESKRLFELSDLQAFDQVRRKLETARLSSASPIGRKRIEERAEEMAEVHTRSLVQSQTNLAKSLLEEDKEDYDPVFARVLLKMASGMGNTEATYLLGYLNCAGIGGELDYEAGARLLVDASERDWVLANYNLGILLMKGWGLDVDSARARLLLDRAAESGFYCAQLVLDGEMEPLLLRDKEDLERAKAAEDTDARAMYSMGCRRARGWLVSRTGWDRELRERFKEAADSGYARAQYAYAEFYYRGYLGERDFELARKYLEMASEQGHAQSYFKLGYIYEKGLDIVSDFEKAKRYYELSCDFGDAWAANSLGALYHDGHLGEKDFEKAMEYYLLAVERGNIVANYNIAEIYLQGRGRAVDLEQAVEWFTKAADRGDLMAAQKLRRLYAKKTVEGDDGDYAYWVERSAELGDVEAMFKIARLYEKGLAVPKNLDRASYWMEQYIGKVSYGSGEWKSAVLSLVRLWGTEGWHGHDPQKALSVCEEMAFPEARLILGKLHLREVSSESDPKEGVSILKRLFKKARKVERDRDVAAEAAYELSNCYAKGVGVSKDPRQRVKWMRESAKIGFKPALYFVARFKIEGKGMPRSLEEGLGEMEALSEKGSKLAILYLGSLLADGTLHREPEDLLWEQIRQLAESGDRKAITLAKRLGIQWDEAEDEAGEGLEPEKEPEGEKKESKEWRPSVLG